MGRFHARLGGRSPMANMRLLPRCGPFKGAAVRVRRLHLIVDRKEGQVHRRARRRRVSDLVERVVKRERAARVHRARDEGERAIAVGVVAEAKVARHHVSEEVCGNFVHSSGSVSHFTWCLFVSVVWDGNL
jgi:hypothetical protein